ncbi:MAG: DUF721 domain-containing protein [Pseudoxanthomonas sp.]
MSDSKSRPRRPSTPRPALEAALTSSGSDPVRRALMLDALEQQLRPALPPGLAAHCRLANLADGRLVFVVDSPIWHARLRLAADALIEQARSLGVPASTLAVRTARAPLQPPAPASPAGREASPVAREAIRTALATLRESPRPDAQTNTSDPRPRHRR